MLDDPGTAQPADFWLHPCDCGSAVSDLCNIGCLYGFLKWFLFAGARVKSLRPGLRIGFQNLWLKSRGFAVMLLHGCYDRYCGNISSANDGTGNRL